MSVDVGLLKQGDVVTLKATFVGWRGGREGSACLVSMNAESVKFLVPPDTIVAVEEQAISIGDVVKIRFDDGGYTVREFCEDFVLLQRIGGGGGLSPYHSCKRHLVRRV